MKVLRQAARASPQGTKNDTTIFGLGLTGCAGGFGTANNTKQAAFRAACNTK
jgi:hypothetical protein